MRHCLLTCELLSLGFSLLSQTIDKKPPLNFTLTSTETLWRLRYGNCDRGYYVDLPPAVVAHGDLAPNPNHGFLISALNPRTNEPVTLDQARIVSVYDEYNSSEIPNPRAQLNWQLKDTPGTRLIIAHDSRFHGLPAADATYRLQANGKPKITSELIVFRGDIIYAFTLITDPAHYATDLLLYQRIKDGFHTYSISSGECTIP